MDGNSHVNVGWFNHHFKHHIISKAWYLKVLHPAFIPPGWNHLGPGENWFIGSFLSLDLEKPPRNQQEITWVYWMILVVNLGRLCGMLVACWSHFSDAIFVLPLIRGTWPSRIFGAWHRDQVYELPGARCGRLSEILGTFIWAFP